VILAVDTSLGTAVALIDADGSPRAEAARADTLGHAEVIGDLLAAVLRDAGGGRVDHVVAGMGPGPFTGLRIGIAAARAFALGRGVPLVPVPSHFAAALSAIEGDGIAERFAVVTDARRREVAITVFEGTDADGIPQVVRETALVPAVDAEQHLADPLGHVAGRRGTHGTGRPRIRSARVAVTQLDAQGERNAFTALVRAEQRTPRGG